MGTRRRQPCIHQSKLRAFPLLVCPIPLTLRLQSPFSECALVKGPTAKLTKGWDSRSLQQSEERSTDANLILDKAFGGSALKAITHLDDQYTHLMIKPNQPHACLHSLLKSTRPTRCKSAQHTGMSHTYSRKSEPHCLRDVPSLSYHRPNANSRLITSAWRRPRTSLVSIICACVDAVPCLHK